MKIIGLTGPTGAGKTSVTQVVKNKFKNIFVVDADSIAHKVIEENIECKEKIIKYFSANVLKAGNIIDRKKLGSIVFGNSKKLKLLNKIIFPYIKPYILEIIKNISESYQYILLDAPTLIESELNTICNKIIIITSSRQNLKKRIMARDNLTEKEAQNRLNSQLKKEEYLKIADYVIYNNRDVEKLQKDVYNIFNKIITN